jgi:hypothetical protein
MSAEKLAPCPVCGGECYLNINCNITCDSYDCDYEVNENIHAEIAAALAYYRLHKDRRCGNCALAMAFSYAETKAAEKEQGK